jgi:hypothetical protein
LAENENFAKIAEKAIRVQSLVLKERKRRMINKIMVIAAVLLLALGVGACDISPEQPEEIRVTIVQSGKSSLNDNYYYLIRLTGIAGMENSKVVNIPEPDYYRSTKTNVSTGEREYLLEADSAVKLNGNLKEWMHNLEIWLETQSVQATIEESLASDLFKAGHKVTLKVP